MDVTHHAKKIVCFSPLIRITWELLEAENMCLSMFLSQCLPSLVAHIEAVGGQFFSPESRVH